MIRLDHISKQHGQQILFLEASAALIRGEKVGLVGPNGAGKSTHLPHDHRARSSPTTGRSRSIAASPSATSARTSARWRAAASVAEAMDGAGPGVATVAAELHAARARAGRSGARRRDGRRSSTRFGEVQARFDELGGYALEARAREILAGLGFAPGGRWTATSARSRAAGRCASRSRASCSCGPTRCCSTSRPTTSTSSRIIWLEGFLQGLRGRAADDLARPRVHEPHRRPRSSRSTAASSPRYSGNYDFYEQQRALDRGAGRRRSTSASRRCSPRRCASSSASRRARPRGAGAVAREEARQDREGRAAQAPQDARVRLPAGAALGRGRGQARRACTRRYGARVIYDGLDLLDPPPRALVRDGRQRRRQVDAAQAGRRRDRSRTRARSRSAPASSSATSRSTRWSCSTRRTTVFETLEDAFPLAERRLAARRSPAASASRATTSRRRCRVLSGGEKARLVLALMLYDPPNFLVLDEPTNHLDMATKEMLIARARDFEGTMLFVSHDRHFLAALSNRVLELTPEGVARCTAAATPSTSRAAATRRRGCGAERSSSRSSSPLHPSRRAACGRIAPMRFTARSSTATST